VFNDILEAILPYISHLHGIMEVRKKYDCSRK